MMQDNRIVYAELFGQRHPMCMTVAADAHIAEVYGSMQGLWENLRSEHKADIVDAYVELSAALLEGGRDRISVLASMHGVPHELPPAIDLRANWGVLTDAELSELTNAALRAFALGRSRTVEAVPSKKSETTQ